MAGLPNVCWATSLPLQGPESYGEPQCRPCSTASHGEPQPFTFALSWPPFCSGLLVLSLALSLPATENGALSFEMSQSFLFSYHFPQWAACCFQAFGSPLASGVSIQTPSLLPLTSPARIKSHGFLNSSFLKLEQWGTSVFLSPLHLPLSSHSFLLGPSTHNWLGIHVQPTWNISIPKSHIYILLLCRKTMYNTTYNKWKKREIDTSSPGWRWVIYTYILFLRLLFFNEKVVNEVARPVVCRVSYATGVSASFTQFFF